MFKVPEDYRVKEGALGSDSSFGNNGGFLVPINHGTVHAFCLVSDGHSYEHVSVTLYDKKNNLIKRCPTWNEMCVIKDIFWDEEDCVMQLHPPKKDWVSIHEFCLHLWRPTEVEIPRPAYYLVGPKKKKT